MAKIHTYRVPRLLRVAIFTYAFSMIIGAVFAAHFSG